MSFPERVIPSKRQNSSENEEKRTTKIEDTSISPFEPVFGFAEEL
jgi:hypothetical protein